MNKVSIDRSFQKIATNQNVLKVVENATVVLKIKGREVFINFSALIIFFTQNVCKNASLRVWLPYLHYLHYAYMQEFTKETQKFELYCTYL